MDAAVAGLVSSAESSENLASALCFSAAAAVRVVAAAELVAGCPQGHPSQCWPDQALKTQENTSH